MSDSAALPSTGRLFGEALEHWIEHQGRFWMLAGPGAVIVTAIPYAKIFSNWVPLGLKLFWIENSFWMDGGAGTFVDALIVYQWFKYALYEDWPKRRALLLQLDEFPWRAFLDLRFIAFWAAYLSCIYVANQAWGAFVSSQMPPATGTPAPWITYVPGEAVTFVREIVLALVFGGFMLFLPARAANLPLGPIDAFRNALGVRGQLIALTLLWSIMALVGETVARLLVLYLQLKIHPDGPSHTLPLSALDIAGSMLGTAIGFVAFYILAYAISRLFIARTGWRPEPLPVPLRLS